LLRSGVAITTALLNRVVQRGRRADLRRRGGILDRLLRRGLVDCLELVLLLKAVDYFQFFLRIFLEEGILKSETQVYFQLSEEHLPGRAGLILLHAECGIT